MCSIVAQRIDLAAAERFRRLKDAAKPFAAFAAYMEAVPRRGLDNDLYTLDNVVSIKQTELQELRAALAELEKEG